jgi:hypothetical protein
MLFQFQRQEFDNFCFKLSRRYLKKVIFFQKGVKGE